MTADFEEAIRELKILFPDIKEILIVILYGSVARGDFSRRHSDLDLLVIIKRQLQDNLSKSISDKVRKVCVKHGVRVHLEFQTAKIKDEDITLLRKMIEEGKVIYSSGIWYFDNRQIGLGQYLIYSYSTKNSSKGTLFSKALHGKKSWYYKDNNKIVKKYSGLIDGKDIISLGKGMLLVKKDRQKDIESSFRNFGIEYDIKRIVYG